jgi:hypothetical protein
MSLAYVHLALIIRSTSINTHVMNQPALTDNISMSLEFVTTAKIMSIWLTAMLAKSQLVQIENSLTLLVSVNHVQITKSTSMHTNVTNQVVMSQDITRT